MAEGAVIFDLDGTLVDSEPISEDAWRSLLAEFDYALTPEDIRSTHGRAYRDIHSYFAQRASLPEAQSLWELYAAILFPSMDQRLSTFRDTITTAFALKNAGNPIGLASSSPRERVDYTLTRTGLRELFTVTVAGDEIRKGKPAPDLFLEVARRLEVAPASCIAIEDSQPGIDAALAAGMGVVGLVRREARPLEGATVVTEELSFDLVARLLREDPGR